LGFCPSIALARLGYISLQVVDSSWDFDSGLSNKLGLDVLDYSGVRRERSPLLVGQLVHR
jgi:hypothetical protein